MQNEKNIKIILASASPRRKQLLSQIAGIDFEVRPSDASEDYQGISTPTVLTMILAGRKARAVFESTANQIKLDKQTATQAIPITNEIVLGADTIVSLGNQILGKPRDKNHARQMLLSLSGKRHQVTTGLCLYSQSKVVYACDKSFVEFTSFSEADIQGYIDSNKPLDKAGAYGIQDDEIQKLTIAVSGSLNNIIGLPTELLQSLLIK